MPRVNKIFELLNIKPPAIITGNSDPQFNKKQSLISLGNETSTNPQIREQTSDARACQIKEQIEGMQIEEEIHVNKSEIRQTNLNTSPEEKHASGNILQVEEETDSSKLQTGETDLNTVQIEKHTESNKLQLEEQAEDVLNEAFQNEILYIDEIVDFITNDDIILETSVQNTQENADSNQGNTESIESSEEVVKRKKRKLPIAKRDETYKENKRKRELGMVYSGKKKNDGKWNYEVMKPKKFLLNPCSCKFSEKYSSLQCQKLDENMRRRVFDVFWKKSWPEKREYVRGHTQIEPVKRRRGENETSRRDYSVKYYIGHDLWKHRVCKKMFNATLGLKQNCGLNWIKPEIAERKDAQDVELTQTPPQKQTRRRKESKNIHLQLLGFFDSLPKMESHYCRASTEKLYLEPMWQSKQELYRFYCDSYCKEQSLKPYSRTLFNEVFEKTNLSLYHPKKDQCEVCVGYRTKNIREEEYQKHLVFKNEARSEKDKDKSQEETQFVFTMDLQSVLLAPKNKVSSMYYKTKLTVHNFTLYNIKTKEGYCYLWSEVEGALTANEFSTILVSFIETRILPNMEDGNRTIIFWSDGCTGQNRNSYLANALLNTAIVHKLTIIQKYLFKGHTQMEADAMHSAIERRIRNKDINVPADYVTHCKNARLNPFPFQVSYLEHTFFKDFSGLKYYSSIRPGRTVGDPTVTDIKQLKYTQDGTIKFKLRHTDDDWQEYTMRVKPKVQQFGTSQLPTLYGERRKIKKEKFDHLQSLKQSIMPDFHGFYDSLPHY